MSSTPPRSPRPLLAAPALATFVALLILGAQGWVWMDPARLAMSDAGPRAGAAEARTGRPAAQPMQQPGPAASPVAGRLALPWLARGYPTPAPKPSAPPPAGPAVLQGYPTAIEVAQGIAYIGAGTVLQVVDVRDPRKPRLLGRSTAPDRPGRSFYAQDIVVSGSSVYMISLDAEAQADRIADNSVLLVFDVTDPAAPRLVQDLGLIDIAYVVIEQDDWLFVGGLRSSADGNRLPGLLSIAKQAPSLRPGPWLETGLLPLDAARLDAQHLVLAGTVRSDAHEERASLGVWDFSQPGRPALLRSWSAPRDKPAWLTSIAILQGLAYAIGSGPLQVLDVSRSDAIHHSAEVEVKGQRSCDPVFIASTGTVAAALGYCSVEGMALFTIPPVGDGSGGTLTITSPGVISFPWDDLKEFQKPIASEGDLLYILANARDGDTLRVVDVSAPDAPVVVGRLR